jgi:hypothetical protein
MHYVCEERRKKKSMDKFSLYRHLGVGTPDFLKTRQELIYFTSYTINRKVISAG